MAKSLDFNTIKKQYLTITLPDEKKTTLMIGTPTKGVMSELSALQDSFNSTEEEQNSETMDILYETCARVMSCNKTKTYISKELLEEIFDLEDIVLFFKAYREFVHEVSSGKN